jgi:hypothetical protein
MYLDMMPHVVSTLGWLPNPLARNVGRFFLHLPDTPDVIKLRCFLKNLPTSMSSGSNDGCSSMMDSRSSSLWWNSETPSKSYSFVHDLKL